jgi:hypothetical protein
MCGFGIGLIFQVAIFVIVVLVIIAILRAAFPGTMNGLWGPYGNIIRIVIGGVIAVVVLLILWRFAECAGIVGRYGVLLPDLRLG